MCGPPTPLHVQEVLLRDPGTDESALYSENRLLDLLHWKSVEAGDAAEELHALYYGHSFELLPAPSRASASVWCSSAQAITLRSSGRSALSRLSVGSLATWT